MRPSRDEVLMSAALLWATRSTCNRLHVGTVVARNSRILVNGYNGPVSGMPHCEHKIEDGPCVEAVHAEANAIVYAAKYGVRLEGADIYSTHFPCPACSKLIVNAGIVRVFYIMAFRDMSGNELFDQVNITSIQMRPPVIEVDMMMP